MHPWCSSNPGKGARFPGIDITDGCESPCACWISNFGALKEEKVLLCPEPSLQTQHYINLKDDITDYYKVNGLTQKKRFISCFGGLQSSFAVTRQLECCHSTTLSRWYCFFPCTWCGHLDVFSLVICLPIIALCLLSNFAPMTQTLLTSLCLYLVIW